MQTDHGYTYSCLR